MARPKKRKTNSAATLQKQLKFLSRELKIEAALEKVRARAMSMRSSAMLAETSAVMFKQIKALGIDATRCGVGIFDDAHDAMEVWLTTASAGEKVLRVLDYVNLHVHPVYENILAARKKKKPFAVTVLKGEEVRHYYNTLSAYKAAPVKKVLAKEETFQSFFFEQGSINVTTAKPLSEEDRAIMVRFAKVFGLIYLRFMDLQKAEAQASEARIEASLERVRGRSLAMYKSNELSEVAVILYRELRGLGVSHFLNCGFVEVDTKEGIQHGWMTRPGGKRIEGFHLPLLGDDILQKRFEAWQKQEPIFYQSVGGAELRKHLEYVSPYSGSKEVDKAITSKLPDPTVFYMFNFSHGYLHIISDALLNADEELLATRFARVFEMAYRRFLDLKISEAQAREAQIEAALERIRSRSMAMQRSEEMSGVIGSVMEQFHQLGFQVDLANFNFHSRSRDWTMWLARPGHAYPELIHLPYLDHKLFNNPREAIKSGLDFLADVLNEREGRRAMEHFLTHTLVGSDRTARARIKKARGLARSMVFGKHITLTISNYKGTPYTLEQNAILRRFHGVFEQSYTRFLNLQNAEAQAKEAEIQLALERVRAKTMAMHRSEELSETAHVLYEQFHNLGLAPDQVRFVTSPVTIGIFNEPEGVIEFWVTQTGTGKAIEKMVKADLGEPTLMVKLFRAWKNNERSTAIHLTGKELGRYVEYLSRLFNVPVTPEQLTANRYVHAAFFSRGMVIISTNEPRPSSTVRLLERFAEVFDLTYTRFLDLQKAEAQAREAEIQLALERVRARTMAMHHSSELGGTSHLLSEQFKALGKSSDQISIGIFSEDDQHMDVYITLAGSQWKKPVRVTFANSEVMQAVHQAWKKNETSIIIDLSGQKLREYNKFRTSVTKARAKNNAQRWIVHAAFFSKGVIIFSTANPQSDKTIRLLERFTEVFNQTYTRFLDLQKAEEQSREVDIQLALERVRAKSLAMHNSNEVGESAETMYEELKRLGLDSARFGIAILYKDKKLDVWNIRNVEKSKPLLVIGQLHMDIHPFLKQIFESWIKKQSSLVGELRKTELESYFTAVNNYPGYPIRVEMDNLPERLFYSNFFFDDGFLYAFTDDPIASENAAIMQRFANSFGQIYRRYQDLIKVERQAREAQIEAALERVRSRSMAMHKSEELAEVITVISEQLGLLHIRFDNVSFAINNDANGVDLWTSLPGWARPFKVNVPYIENPTLANPFKARQQGRKFHQDILTQKENQAWTAHVFAHNRLDLPEKVKTYMLESGFARSVAIMPNIMLILGNYLAKPYREEVNQVIQRFGLVFEQSYTRFLDLQKAEAQSREAQIQLALERVRARTMAMQSSEELAEVSFLLNKQVVDLGIPTRGCAFNIYNEHDSTEWFSNLEGTLPTYKTPRENIFLKYYEAGQRGETLWIEEFGGEKIKKHYAYLFSVNILGIGPEHAHQVNASIPDHQVDHVAYFKYGYLLFITLAPAPEAHDVFRRFAKEFEQTYTRFLDLQKAEAQTREAQIEAALERVRARAMAMHHSDELKEVASVMREQFSLLGQPQLETVAIHIYPEDGDTFTSWFAVRPPDNPGNVETYTTQFSKSTTQLAREMLSRYKSKSGEYTIRANGKAMAEWLEMLFRAVPSLKQVWGDNIPHEQYWHFSDFSAGTFVLIPREEPSKESKDLLRRSASVFDLAYRRYADLKKAEAQAREGQIQLAMERVRARTMAMQKSDELPEAANLLFQQVQGLGMPAWSAGYCIWDEDKKAITLWMSSEGVLQPSFKLPLTEDPSCIRFLEAHQRGETFYVEEIGGEEIKKHYQYMQSLPVVGDVLQSIIDAGFPLPTFQIFHCAYFSKGFLLFITYEPVPEAHDIFKRFGQVFDQTYTRFLDLQKAEAQAREAQIEAALERVRSRSLAMHKSDELQDVVNTVHKSMLDLGVQSDVSNFIIFSEDPLYSDCWLASAENLYSQSFRIPTIDLKPSKQFRDAREKGVAYLEVACNFEEKNKWFNWAFEHSGFSAIPDKRKKNILERERWTAAYALAKYSAIQMSSFSRDSFTPEEREIAKRFTHVFEQAYVRFLDLQKAEVQAREGQIETSLERVRAASMAMHKSEELSEVIKVISEQLVSLGLKFDNTYFTRVLEDGSWDVYLTTPVQPYPAQIRLSYIQQVMATVNAAIAQGRELFVVYSKEEKDAYVSHFFANTIARDTPEARKQHVLGSPGWAMSLFVVKDIGLGVTRYETIPFSDSDNAIVKRFSKVFEQSYIRYLDLQKAEAQAREATIQASLERVRAKAMAMHNSKDLAETIHAFYQELVSMNLTPRRCGIGLMDKNSLVAEISSMNTTEKGISVETIGQLDMKSHPVLTGVYEHWLEKKEYRPVLRGHEIKAYYQVLRKQVAIPDYPPDAVHFGYFFFFEDGGVYAWTEKELLEDELSIYRRFTSVLSLTYKRYKDLKDAEARAIEAVKQASLDRVRAEIASMRHANDLQRITPLIWRELTTLGVPFFRCGVMIAHEKENHVDFYLSTPDGKPLAALHLDSDGQEVTKKAMAHWRRQEVYTDHWDREQFAAFAQSMIEQGQIQNTSAYQGGEQPPESLTLQFTPFAQGMLYVGSEEHLSTEQLELLRSLAEAFSTAYARYEDFTRLEAAKATVEKALSELRITQNQLVQSEKMASLGELTAGIAHEIQNPLNFVNNFSEVSKELLDEMEDELKKGNNQDALQIAKDIINNLEKINFHGKRADGIVKSMLQHSRKSTGQKELTDINALCDEYLRLSFHGLRAKDKSFNAKFETDFDPAVGPISVLPQEIGRVILNLINNAFFAVTEKRKLNVERYEPTVTVTTRKLEGKVEIRVIDNGIGIPASIIDKILHPFFTTKPTGQGTGLGLSLSYDIIKAHRGEIQIKSEEGKGSEFIVSLPS